MIPTPVEARDMAEVLLEEEPVVEEATEEKTKPKDCGNKKCYKYRFCWACKHWLGCKELPLGTCFDCATEDCPELMEVVDDCESCKLPGVE